MWIAISEMIGGLFKTIQAGIRARRERRQFEAEGTARMRAESRRLGEQRSKDMGNAAAARRRAKGRR